MKVYDSTLMSKESAQWIANSLYSIMMAFALSFAFFECDFENYSPSISRLSIILFLYYLLDWMSYNAILDYVSEQEHYEVFFTIVFILTLGWLLVVASYVNDTLIIPYCLFSCIYLVTSTILIALTFWRAYKKQQAAQSHTATLKGFITTFKRAVPDAITRILGAFALLMIYVFRDKITMLIWQHFILLAVFSAILFAKYLRYQFLLCPLIRKANKTEPEVKDE